MAKARDKREPTFEEALAELERIVSAIDEGKVSLEEAIAQYEKGMKLIQHCRSVLGQAESKIQQLQVGQDGQVTTSPLTLSESDASEED